MIKIQKVKQRVGYLQLRILRCMEKLFGFRQTKACPAALSFLGKGWVSSASLETGIQVDVLTNRPLLGETTYGSPLNNRFTSNMDTSEPTCLSTSDVTYSHFKHTESD